MTYGVFLLLFLVAPIAVLAGVLRRRLLRRRFMLPAAALLLLALAYMAPWDHTAAVWGLWTWAPGRTWGMRWWAIPPEEYLFCLLEALFAVLLTCVALGRPGGAAPARPRPAEDETRL
jgi:lycopene cyclase domain-containing protein